MAGRKKQTGSSDDAPDRPRRKRTLSPAAQRALEEARQRQEGREDKSGDVRDEVGGRDGPDPVRYGDWEKDGIVSDF